MSDSIEIALGAALGIGLFYIIVQLLSKWVIKTYQSFTRAIISIIALLLAQTAVTYPAELAIRSLPQYVTLIVIILILALALSFFLTFSIFKYFFRDADGFKLNNQKVFIYTLTIFIIIAIVNLLIK